jgi:hypothetical protein
LHACSWPRIRLTTLARQSLTCVGTLPLSAECIQTKVASPCPAGTTPTLNGNGFGGNIPAAAPLYPAEGPVTPASTGVFGLEVSQQQDDGKRASSLSSYPRCEAIDLMGSDGNASWKVATNNPSRKRKSDTALCGAKRKRTDVAHESPESGSSTGIVGPI